MIIYVEIGQQSIAADVAERYEYNNNQVNAIHHLVVEDGVYKINVTETLTDTIVLIDQDGNPIQ
ncbi:MULTISPECIES: hypothetical protein [Allobacillus]|uniref:PepSY domain-containing protein n=1 Tax=Allobacillus halotolerans TaxID=570278 RepID=A0ABS6GMH1_9BACI|nr:MULTISPECIES: hypothetical protein [Allobacillus]MBU6079839.1 hypothetical protein [Allobacillus halotolerans]TSJ67920.1 hypothetical protein FPQ10_05025 [Allobacillus sp. SKP2-8]